MPELEERIAVLETDLRYTRLQLTEMSEKVSEMHELLLQAKGARWAILGIAGLSGFLAGKLGGVLALFSTKI